MQRNDYMNKLLSTSFEPLWCRECRKTAMITDIVDLADKADTVVADCELECGHVRELIVPVRDYEKVESNLGTEDNASTRASQIEC